MIVINAEIIVENREAMHDENTMKQAANDDRHILLYVLAYHKVLFAVTLSN